MIDEARSTSGGLFCMQLLHRRQRADRPISAIPRHRPGVRKNDTKELGKPREMTQGC